MDDNHSRSLEHFFSQNSKPTVQQKEHIARGLNLPLVAVQSWFVERRLKAKEDKCLEEAQAMAALESAHQISPFDSLPITHTQRPKTHRTQSAASYASLARSLKVAAASMTNNILENEQNASPIYSYAGSPQSYSPTNASFDITSSSMTRNDSQWSNLSTPADVPDFQSFPWGQSYYMPTPQAIQNTMIYEDPAQRDIRPLEMPKGPLARPRMQRTWTAPENFGGRQPAYRSVSMPMPNENNMTESMPIRRRPKLSTSAVGMARSRSSLGYENEPLSTSRRTPCTSEFPYPLTPVRRIASTTAVPTLAGMKSSTKLQDGNYEVKSSMKKQEAMIDTDLSFSMQFPPSPISPEHGSIFQQAHHVSPLDTISTLPELPILEDVFTPPHTPLTALSSSSENILANTQDKLWMNNAFTMCEADFMHNDLTLGDVFSEEMMALESY